MVNVESLGRHVVDGMGNFFHDFIAQIEIGLIVINQLFGFFDSFFLYLFQVFINIFFIFELEEQGVYFLLLFEDNADDLLQSA